MRIYTASSWKNESAVLVLAKMLRSTGHEVYCFAERGQGQHVFQWNDCTTTKDDGITALQTEDSRKAYNADKFFLDWANCCVLLNPCGRDAHLEAGYIKGRGGLLLILGPFPQGEFSNMYHLADGLFRLNQEGIRRMLTTLENADAIAKQEVKA